MVKFNPRAAVFWAFCVCVGFLLTGTFTGAVVGLTVGLGVSIIVSAF